MLLNANAEIDHISQFGIALFLAARWNHIEVVKTLLEYGAGDIPAPKQGTILEAHPNHCRGLR